MLGVLASLAGCGGEQPSPAAPIAQGRCPADAFCFNVSAGAPGPLGAVRILTLWSAPDDKSSPTPDLVELAQLTGSEHSVVIPRSRLRPPARMGVYGVTWGYVFAVPVNAGPTSPKQAVGIGQMMFTHALAAIPPNTTYPAGAAVGVEAYRMARGRGSHDSFHLASAGTVFDLVICPTTQPKCDLPTPNPD